MTGRDKVFFPYICDCGFSTTDPNKAYIHSKQHCIDCGKKVDNPTIIDGESFCEPCARRYVASL